MHGDPRRYIATETRGVWGRGSGSTFRVNDQRRYTGGPGVFDSSEKNASVNTGELESRRAMRRFSGTHSVN